MFPYPVLGVEMVATLRLPLANVQETIMQLFPSPVQRVISRGSTLKYATASSHDICNIRAHNIMFAPQSPHSRLDLNMETKFPPCGPFWSSTMFINKHMWIHHKTVILFLCIMRLKTSGSCFIWSTYLPIIMC